MRGDKLLKITLEIVQNLVYNQFPQWNHLTIKPVEKSGHDNRTFHLGNDMTVRLPSGEAYAAQVEKELKWLPFLAQHISIPISTPIAKGGPDQNYPYVWSVNKYLPGDTLSYSNIDNLIQFADELAMFLKELQSIDTKDAPIAGKHNFYRGGDLSVYNQETKEALSQLSGYLPTKTLKYVWEHALDSKWDKKDVWIHGDVAPGNILVANGKLCGVIDFGIMGVGDPSCDYAMAWTFFDRESRKEFMKYIDKNTIDRARGWALWKALITYNSENIIVAENSRFTIQAILDEVV
jgi:aminoglycoside phosphotransferase (APT) family kinase protein